MCWLIIYLLEIAITAFLFGYYVRSLDFSKFDIISAQPDPLWMVCGSEAVMFSDPRSPNVNQLTDDSAQRQKLQQIFAETYGISDIDELKPWDSQAGLYKFT